MNQEFDLRINNKSVIIESGTLHTFFDRPVPFFKASIPLTKEINANITKDMSPYAGPPAKVFLENELMFTGLITDPGPLKTSNSLSWNATGSASTIHFRDSQLEPPYEINKVKPEELAKFATAQTGTAFIFEEQAKPLSTGSFPSGAAAPAPTNTTDSESGRETVNQGETGFTFCGRVISKPRNMVMGCTENGELIFRQPDLKSPVIGTIEEGKDFKITEYQANFDIAKRFRTLKAITDTRTNSESAISENSNIKFPRHKIVTVTNQIAGGVQANADWQMNLLAIKALTKEFNLIGWKIDGKFIKVNSRITIVSPTMGFPDGFTFFINSAEYDKRADSKGVKIGVIPPNVYTNQTVVEPYFSG